MRDAIDIAPRGDGGFTLLETLTALVILAIGLTALLQSHGGAARVTGTTEDYAYARLIGEKVLSETLGTWRGGTYGASGTEGRYGWVAEIKPEAAAWAKTSTEKGWALYRVDVKVNWPGARNLQLATLKLGAAK